jgi:hypothetical protein
MVVSPVPRLERRKEADAGAQLTRNCNLLASISPFDTQSVCIEVA